MKFLSKIAIATAVVVLSACSDESPSNVSKPGVYSQQDEFCGIISSYRGAYISEKNKDVYIDQKATLKSIYTQRIRKLKEILKSGEVSNWEGVINNITVSEGKGAFLEVKLSCGVYLEPQDNLIISIHSPLYQDLRRYSENMRVKFSGNFILPPDKESQGKYPHKTYYGETSFTENGSMKEPEFLFKFSVFHSEDVLSINKPQDFMKNPTQYPKPVPVAITFISKNIIPGIKRGLVVRLDKKVTKEVLADVAVKIKNSDPNKYERTLISYYLPNMEVGKGGWANTHFDPDLEIMIFGLAVEEEEILRSSPDDPAHKVVGSWIEELFKRKTTIFTKDGKTFIGYVYPDGSSGVKELIKKNSGGNITFHEAGNIQSKDYYFIDQNGDLHTSDEIGSISIGRKIE